MTGMLALFTFIYILGISCALLGTRFVKLFIPSGIPSLLLPFLFIIEITSYLSRLISLSVRLSANMNIGHLVISSLSLSIFQSYIMGAVAPTGIISTGVFVLFLFLESFVCLLQSLVFFVLCSLYLKDPFFI